MAKNKSHIDALAVPDLMGRDLSDATILFHHAVASHLGMSAGEWKCLGLLQQHGALSASRLAELSGFTTGAITGIVDRLEDSGYARREPHPVDRRGITVQLRHSKDLRQRVAPIFQSVGRAIAEVEGRYSADELAAIARFFRETAEVLGKEAAKLKRQKQHRV
jgi:DNA-binding MarR family transcriptional regulator